MKQLFKLFFTFFKIGLFTFGGGYAMISLIEDECVNKNKWLSKQDMQEIVVLSESTPGPIAINASTFIGYKIGKFFGSAFATLGVILPSLVIIVIISIFLNSFKDNLFINFVFQGIRASVILLMFQAFLNLSKNIRKNAINISLLLTAFVLNFFFNVKAIYIIIFALIYTVFYLILTKNKKEVKENA